MRKVIQLVCDVDDKGALYALCDDGTIWQRVYKISGYVWYAVEGPIDAN